MFNPSLNSYLSHKLSDIWVCFSPIHHFWSDLSFFLYELSFWKHSSVFAIANWITFFLTWISGCFEGKLKYDDQSFFKNFKVSINFLLRISIRNFNIKSYENFVEKHKKQNFNSKIFCPSSTLYLLYSINF